MNPGQGLVVKICGLRGTAPAVASVAAGADLLGFNFAPVSRRRVAPGAAGEAIVAARDVPGPGPGRDVVMVGVFVNQTIEEVVGIAAGCRLDAVQLSGAEDAAYCRRVASETGLPVIKAVRLGPPGAAGAADQIDELQRLAVESGVASLLVDAPVAGSWGGSGQGWDWVRAAPLARRLPVLLAGGLHAGNVASALGAVGPWGVDVASGVETEGQTDPIRVAAFIARVRAGACRE